MSSSKDQDQHHRPAARLASFPPASGPASKEPSQIDLTNDQDDDNSVSGAPQINRQPFPPPPPALRSPYLNSTRPAPSTPTHSLRITSTSSTIYRNSSPKEKAWHGVSDMSTRHGVTFSPQDPTQKLRPTNAGYQPGSGGWTNSSAPAASSSSLSASAGRGRGGAIFAAPGASRVFGHALNATRSTKRNPTKNLPTTAPDMSSLGKINNISEGGTKDRILGRPPASYPTRPAPPSATRETALTAAERRLREAASNKPSSSTSSTFSVKGKGKPKQPSSLGNIRGSASADAKGKGKANAEAGQIILSDDDDRADDEAEDEIESADDEDNRSRKSRSIPLGPTRPAAARRKSSPDPLMLGQDGNGRRGPYQTVAQDQRGRQAQEAKTVIRDSGNSVTAKLNGKTVSSLKDRKDGAGDPEKEFKFVPRRRAKAEIFSLPINYFVVEIAKLGQLRVPVDSGDYQLMVNLKGGHLTLTNGKGSDICNLRPQDVAEVTSFGLNTEPPMLWFDLSDTAKEVKCGLARSCRFSEAECAAEDIKLWVMFPGGAISELPADSDLGHLHKLVTNDWRAKIDGFKNPTIDGSGHKFHVQRYNSALVERPGGVSTRSNAGAISSTVKSMSSKSIGKQRQVDIGSDDDDSHLKGRESISKGTPNASTSSALVATRSSERAKRVPRKAAEAAQQKLSFVNQSEAQSAVLEEELAWVIEEDGTPLEKVVLVYPLEGDKTVVSVTHGDTKRLADGKYLNDTLIEYGLKRAFLKLLAEDDNREEGRMAPDVHMFNSFFYKKLDRRGITKQQAYDSVFKWTAKFDLFAKKIVIVPIHEKNHWYLAIVYNPGVILDGPRTMPKEIRKSKRSLGGGTATPTSDKAASPVATRNADDGDTSSRLSNPSAVAEAPVDINAPVDTSRFFARKAGESSKPEQDVGEIDLGNSSEDENRRVPETDEERIEETQERFSAMDVDDGFQMKARNAVAQEEDPEETVMLDGETVLASIVNRDIKQDDPHRNGGRSSSTSDGETSSKAVEQTLVPSASSVQPPPVTIRPSTRPPGDGSPPSKHEARQSSPDDDVQIQPAITERCWVITFDSLGDHHRSVVNNLKEYLRREAMAKKSIDIDETWLKDQVQGVSADVPQQDNCSDCGLYLIHFVERFLADPKECLAFVLNQRDRKAALDRVKNKTSQEKIEARKKLHTEMEHYWKAAAAKSKRRELREEVKSLAEQWAIQRKPIEEEEARRKKEKAAKKAEGNEARKAAALAEQRAEKGDEMADLPDPTTVETIKATGPRRSDAQDVGDQQYPADSASKSEDDDAIAQKNRSASGSSKRKAGLASKGGNKKKKLKQEVEQIELSSDEDSASPATSPVRRTRGLSPVSSTSKAVSSTKRHDASNDPRPEAMAEADPLQPQSMNESHRLPPPAPPGQSTSPFRKPVSPAVVPKSLAVPYVDVPSPRRLRTASSNEGPTTVVSPVESAPSALDPKAPQVPQSRSRDDAALDDSDSSQTENRYSSPPSKRRAATHQHVSPQAPLTKFSLTASRAASSLGNGHTDGNGSKRIEIDSDGTAKSDDEAGEELQMPTSAQRLPKLAASSSLAEDPSDLVPVIRPAKSSNRKRDISQEMLVIE